VFHCKDLWRVFLHLLRQVTVISISASLLIACDKTDPDVAAGEAVFNQTCKVCHASGINGAPIVGNRKMWQARSAQGVDTLVEHASQGFGLMPAKGGNETLSDEQIRQAVKYFLARLEGE
jgi:cytochrome c5